MNEEQIKQKFRELFPEYTVKDSEVCLSPYIDIFEAGIEIATKELQEENDKQTNFSKLYLKEVEAQRKQIEKMKCCGNCIHCYEGAYHNGFRCKDHARESVCDNWEMMTDEVRKEMLEDD